jgi:hypothetical protein
LNYNDGGEIERLKFDQTAEELSDRFGGITQDTVRIAGTWHYGNTPFSDSLIRIHIDTKDKGATDFMKRYKDSLKQRFRQIDIWITAQELEII